MTDYSSFREFEISPDARAMAAIQDGELGAFSDALLELKPEDYGTLLIAAASTPGIASDVMTERLLERAENISNEKYLTACKGAVDTGDTERAAVSPVTNSTHPIVSGDSPPLYGEVALYVYTPTGDRSGSPSMVAELVRQSTPEQIAAPPYILEFAAFRDDHYIASMLIDKGISAGDRAPIVFAHLAHRGSANLIAKLVAAGNDVNPADFGVLRNCMDMNDIKTAVMLIGFGADFDGMCEYMRSSTMPLSERERNFLSNVSDELGQTDEDEDSDDWEPVNI